MMNFRASASAMKPHLQRIQAVLAGAAVPRPAPAPPRAIAHADVFRRVTDRPVRVLALGASDVVGVGASHPERDGWAAVLAKLLPGSVALTRLGISGAKAADLRARLLPKAIAAAPDVAVIWTGVNDCVAGVPVDRFTEDLDALVGGLVAAGTRVHVVNLPDVHRLPAFRAYALPIGFVVGRWQAAVRHVAARHGATPIELGDHTLELIDHPEYLCGDGFHPSSAGHRRLAEIFARSIGA